MAIGPDGGLPEGEARFGLGCVWVPDAGPGQARQRSVAGRLIKAMAAVLDLSRLSLKWTGG
jgi:hypothetical protein